MTYLKLFKKFANDTSGAVTVDWVVLTAAAGFLAIGVVAGINRATTDQAKGIGAATLQIGTCSLDESTC